MSSFRIIRDVTADTYLAPLESISLTFTGPFTITVNCNVQKIGSVIFLTIPKFQGDVENETRRFTAIVPSNISFPQVRSSSTGVPVLSGPGLFPGYIIVSKPEEDILVEIVNLSANYIGSAGLYTDVTLMLTST